MSRIGRKEIAIPAGVEVKLNGNVITVKGPKGTLENELSRNMIVTVEGSTIKVARPDDDKMNRSLHGLTRTLIANMIVGVTEGYSKKLEIVGVGYKAAKSGKNLVLNLGHSHTITFTEDDKITFEVPDSTTVIVKGYDKQLVGAIAAQIRANRPPEPFHGKGVKYSDERIRRKAGKTGK